MLELTLDTYAATIESVASPMILLFWSPKDDLSLKIHSQLAMENFGSLPIYGLDIVAQRQAAITVELMGIPTILVVYQGQVLLRLSGPSGCKNWKSAIQNWMASNGFSWEQ